MLLTKSSEIKWLKSCLKGNAKAFEHIVHEYQPLVCAITYSGTGNSQQSEELDQEIFIKAWTNLHQLQDISKFRSWLCRIAQTTTQNWFRSQKRDIVAQAAPLDAAGGTASTELNPEEKTIHRENEVLVNQALSQLPITHREALVLYYREHQSTQQVARQLDISEGAARQRISRGRQMLRHKLQSIVEDTLIQTRPGKAFTAGVMTSIATLGIKSGSAVAASCSLGSRLATQGFCAGIAGKLSIIAVGLAVVVGGLTLHRQSRSNTVSTPSQSQAPVSPMKTQNTLDNALATPATAKQLPVATGQDQPTVREPESHPTLSIATESRPTSTEPYAFNPQGVLSGLVTDIDTDEPIANAWVSLNTYPPTETQTDAHGFYAFLDVNAVTPRRITVESETHVDPERRGLNYSTLELAPDTQSVKHFQLAKGCCLEVQIVDSNGVGIPSTCVLASAPYDILNQTAGFFGTSKRGELMQTDPNGMLVMGPFPSADTDYLIETWVESRSDVNETSASQALQGHYDYAPAKTLIRLDTPSDIKQVKISLEQGETVYAYVEYADGVPATDIEMGAYPPTWPRDHRYYRPRYPVDSSGIVALHHVTPGTYQFEAHFPREAGLSYNPSIKIAEAYLPPGNEESLTLRIPAASPQNQTSISGTFSIHNVSRLLEIEISLSDSITTRSTGSYFAPGPGTMEQSFCFNRIKSGSYTLTFSGEFIETKILDPIESPSTNLTVELYPIIADSNLSGVVTDLTTGKSIEHFKLRVCKLKTLRGLVTHETPRTYEFKNPSGRFSLNAGLAIYQLEVVAEGYAPQWSEEINLDINNTVNMTLSPGGHITGSVSDASGRSILGAQVIPLCYACGADPEERSLFVTTQGADTTIDGQFSLQHLAPGLETLKIVHPDYAPSILDQIEVVDGQSTRDIVITLQTGGILEGIVYDGKGNPQPDQRLLFMGQCESKYLHMLQYSPTHQWASAVTDSNGVYHIEHLPEQLCTVYRANHETELGVVRCTVTPINGTVQHLNLGDTGLPSVMGNVVLNGTPLMNNRLLLASEDSGDHGDPMCFAETDEWGSFVFRGISPGTHAIYYVHPNRFREYTKIATIEVQSRDLGVGVIYYDIDADD